MFSDITLGRLVVAFVRMFIFPIAGASIIVPQSTQQLEGFQVQACERMNLDQLCTNAFPKVGRVLFLFEQRRNRRQLSSAVRFSAVVLGYAWAFENRLFKSTVSCGRSGLNSKT